MLPTYKSTSPVLHILLLCALALAPIRGWAGDLKLVVLLSDNSTPYLSFAKELGNSLPESARPIVLEYPDQLPAGLPQADLIITAGMKATEFALARSNAPVLATMVTKINYEDLLTRPPHPKTARAISAIYLDQPWGRQIDFLRAALPERRRIGVLYSNDLRFDIAPLRQSITHRGGSLVALPIHVADGIFPGLDSILDISDILLAIPDSTIYSGSNIRNILLTSYRHGVPLVGLSQSYVNAGALCAIFSTPEQLAEQAGSAVISFAKTGLLPDSQYPAAFTIAVNQQVARSLGIALPAPDAIRNRMDKAKEK